MSRVQLLAPNFTQKLSLTSIPKIFSSEVTREQEISFQPPTPLHSQIQEKRIVRCHTIFTFSLK